MLFFTDENGNSKQKPTQFPQCTSGQPNSLDEDWVTPSRGIREFLFQRGF